MVSPARSFDLQKLELILNGVVVKVYCFQDDGMPWFVAKPMVTYLGYVTLSQTLADHVDAEDKMSLADLIKTKGQPQGGGVSQTPPLGYNELKALCINEPGMYSLMLGSKKPEAKEFKKWACNEVFPSIRRRGSYGLEDSAISSLRAEFQQALQKRDKDLHTVTTLTTTTLSELQQSIVKRESDFLAVWQQREQKFAEQQAEYLEVVNGLRTSILEAMGAKFSGFVLSLAGHINATVTAAVSKGLSLKKAQTKKRTANPVEMPEEQHATPVQTGPLSLGLSTVALELFPDLCFAIWRKLRGAFGYYAKLERMRLHALGSEHAEYVEMPLLWAYTGASGAAEGGGARYIYLGTQRSLLRRVFQEQRQTTSAQRRAGAPRPTESLEQRAHRLTARLTEDERRIQWPIHAAELEPQWDEAHE
jgi:prophage antirepressor-like protein